MAQDKQSFATSPFFSQLYVDHLGIDSRFAWDATTCGGNLNYKHDEPTSFFIIIPIEAAHRRLSRRPPQLGG